MPRSRCAWLPVPLLTALLAGCNASPEVRVLALDHVSSGTTADEYALRVELRNPNAIELVLDRWNYSVGTTAGSWSSEWVATRTLPPRSIVVERLPVVLTHGAPPAEAFTPEEGPPAPADGTAPVTAAATESLRWQVNGSLQYLLPGQLAETLFDLGVSRPDVGFSGSGTSASPGQAAQAVDPR